METPAPLVSIAFTPVSPSSRADSPNLRLRFRTPDSASPYYLAMAAAFASLRRANPDLSLQLISTIYPPLAHAQLLDKLSVHINIVPFAHRPPTTHLSAFVTSFYTLDALEATSGCPGPAILLDPDVLCLRPLDPILARVSDGVGALELDRPADEPINGLSRRQAGQLHQLLEPTLSGTPRHYGGEIYVTSAPIRSQFLSHARAAWEFSTPRLKAGFSGFTTEEHLLSYALRRLASVVKLNPLTARIWTARTYRRVPPNIQDLTLWHVPAEKGRGLTHLGSILLRRSDAFSRLSDEEFAAVLQHACGLPHRSPRRWAGDTAATVAKRLRQPFT
jgi:hypothetical protein